MNIFTALARALSSAPKPLLALCALGSLLAVPAADAAISITFTYDSTAGTIVIASAGSAPTSTTGGGSVLGDTSDVFSGGLWIDITGVVIASKEDNIQADGPWHTGSALYLYSESTQSELSIDLYLYLSSWEDAGLAVATSTGTDLILSYGRTGDAADFLVRHDSGSDSLTPWGDGTMTLTETTEGALASLWANLSTVVGDGLYYATASDAEHLIDVTLVDSNVPEPSTYAAILGGACLLVIGLKRVRRR
ncbi:PEP-CTERM sorting domain-containing protein [Ruficoccus sp. ZRK36]|uniref:PEP-CTERM sorting domain-containing protein n=1 Tax=Ruficoccus sp. ZRK36 TaxID=2866311 RepID=UPI001C739F76|nr:PEP-CTERM sorting domain-containing protein [Ruficoccus sp. ZRK36]QYY37035.1 PEP-CTERM sorting domain-containing protein [Ruficoccus sp. ZRK36]